MSLFWSNGPKGWRYVHDFPLSSGSLPGAHIYFSQFEMFSSVKVSR